MLLDYQIFKFINNFATKNPIWDKIGFFLAAYLPYALVAAAAAFAIYWIIKNKSWRVFWQMLLAFVLSRLIITEIIRFLWHRPRPFISHSVNLLLNHDLSGSFPSGHMTLLFPLAAIVYFYNKKIGWLLFVLSFMVGIARVFVGVHYPADILVGMAIGILSAGLIYHFSKK